MTARLDVVRRTAYTIFRVLHMEASTLVDGFELESDLYRALAHPVRLRILELLSRAEACVCHLTAVLDLRQPYVSQQLATLRDAELVVDRRDGNLVYYRLKDPRLAGLLALGRDVVRATPAGARAIYPDVAEGAVETCPCPRCATCEAAAATAAAVDG